MKLLSVLLLAMLSLPAMANDAAEEDPDAVANALTSCLAASSGENQMDNRRSCITACYDNARNTIDGNMCAGTSRDIEKTEYERLYDDAVKNLEASINDPGDDFNDVSQELLNRLNKYNAKVADYLEVKCSLAATDMLDGSGEISINLGCLGEEYRNASKFLSELTAISRD